MHFKDSLETLLEIPNLQGIIAEATTGKIFLCPKGHLP